MFTRAAAGAAICVAITALTASAASAATERAHWSMNDTGSSMADSSGNGNKGTLKNVTTGVAGSSGTAFSFTKKPAYVQVPDDATLDPGTADFTITLKVKFTINPPSSVGDYDLLRKGLSSTSGGSYKVEIDNGKALCNFRGSGGQAQINAGPAINDGSWHTITCARTSSTVKLTVDGKSWSTSKSTGKISNSSSVLIGAKDSSGNDQYNGALDEVVIS
jgi:hypothetical protein